MPYYAETKLSHDFDLIVGIDKGAVIFSHTFAIQEDKEKWLTFEKTYYPDMREDSTKLRPIFEDLESYKRGDGFDPAAIEVIFSRGTAFEKHIWKTLRMIKKGETISYQQLGEKAGFPKAQRAVGRAMAKNYLLLFVPCHRVIARGNGLGGFSAGINKKKFLLALENNS